MGCVLKLLLLRLPVALAAFLAQHKAGSTLTQPLISFKSLLLLLRQVSALCYRSAHLWECLRADLSCPMGHQLLLRCWVCAMVLDAQDLPQQA